MLRDTGCYINNDIAFHRCHVIGIMLGEFDDLLGQGQVNQVSCTVVYIHVVR